MDALQIDDVLGIGPHPGCEDVGRRRSELLDGQVGQDEDMFASDEALHQPERVLGELFSSQPPRTEASVWTRIFMDALYSTSSSCLMLPGVRAVRQCLPNVRGITCSAQLCQVHPVVRLLLPESPPWCALTPCDGLSATRGTSYPVLGLSGGSQGV